MVKYSNNYIVLLSNDILQKSHEKNVRNGFFYKLYNNSG